MMKPDSKTRGNDSLVRIAHWLDFSKQIGSAGWWARAAVVTGALFTASALVTGNKETGPASAPVIESDVVAADNEQQAPATALATSETLVKTEMEKLPEMPETSVVRLKPGQQLMTALRSAGVDGKVAWNAVQALSEHMNMRKLSAGQEFTLEWSGESGGTLQRISARDQFDRVVAAEARENGFSSLTESLPTLGLTRYAEGEITDSLFLSAEREGVPAAVIVEFIRLFSFDVDFQREIWPGNQFEILFDRQMNAEYGDLREGDVLYAKLVLRDRTLELTRFEDTEGRIDYFNQDGKSVRKALMKTPIDGARLSSSFNPNRKHPVLGYRRAHKGVDFSAPTGTPIMAAGDGVIERASRWGSFGNYVRIRHNGTWKTAYAHLSKYGRGIKKGVRVRQGQIIGYVGATGRVTGRHLHYEVHKNGVAINPMTMKLPSGRVLKGDELDQFNTLYAEIQDERQGSSAFESVRVAHASERAETAVSR